MTYAILVSPETLAAWPSVVQRLVEVHDATVVHRESDLLDLCPLAVAFVAQWHECTRDFTVRALQLSREADPSHPFSDFRFGIITGACEADALRQCEGGGHTIAHVASGSAEGVQLRAFQSGVAFDELVQHRVVVKAAGGGAPEEQRLEGDSAPLIAEAFSAPETGLIITSGHARETEWNIGFRWPGGQFRVREGAQMVSVTAAGDEQPLRDSAATPKVYSAAGNCLMAHVSHADCMALAWMHTLGVRQMQGYTRPTWFGYAGWGTHKFLFANVGRMSFAEAWFANHQCLLQRLGPDADVDEEEEEDHQQTYLRAGAGAGRLDPAQRDGLRFDRDHCVFYGDPLYDARLAPMPDQQHYDMALSEDGCVVRITTLQAGSWSAPAADDKEVLPGRPPVLLLERPGAPVLVDGDVVATPLFVLVALEGAFEAGEVIERRVRPRMDPFPPLSPWLQGLFGDGAPHSDLAERVRAMLDAPEQLLPWAAGPAGLRRDLAAVGLMMAAFGFDTSVRVAGDARGGPLALLLGWAGSELADLGPAEALYAGLGVATAAAVRRAHSLPAARRQVAALVAAARAAADGSVVVHLFSNNGFYLYIDVLRALGPRLAARKLRGVVFDSAPLAVYNRDLITGILHRMVVRRLGAAGVRARDALPVKAALRDLADRPEYDRLFNYGPKVRWLAAAEPPGLARLFLYGRGDLLVKPAAVEAFHARMRKLHPGAVCDKVCFAGSQHCQHLAVHGEAYGLAVGEFVRGVGLLSTGTSRAGAEA